MGSNPISSTKIQRPESRIPAFFVRPVAKYLLRRNFPQARFWPTSVLPTIRSELTLIFTALAQTTCCLLLLQSTIRHARRLVLGKRTEALG